MTTKHTPGPWKLEAGRSFTTSSGEFYLTYGSDRYGNPNFRNFCELDANARLIAEAPAMAEILARLAVLPDHSPEWLENPSVRVDFRMAVTTARAILARIDNHN